VTTNKILGIYIFIANIIILKYAQFI